MVSTTQQSVVTALFWLILFSHRLTRSIFYHFIKCVIVNIKFRSPLKKPARDNEKKLSGTNELNIDGKGINVYTTHVRNRLMIRQKP